jgi:hypothetical protein
MVIRAASAGPDFSRGTYGDPDIVPALFLPFLSFPHEATGLSAFEIVTRAGN